jgi:hypothetical protein
MFINSSAFPAELADIGLAAAADPSYAERLIAALLLDDSTAPVTHRGAELLADDRQGAAA